MSKLEELLEKKRLFEELQKEIAELESSKDLQEEKKFFEELESLLKQYNKTFEDLRSLIPAQKHRLKIGEEIYEVGARGRLPPDLKILLDKSKLSRKDFIKKYEIDIDN